MPATVRKKICGLSAFTLLNNNIIQITEIVTSLVFYARGTLSVKMRGEHRLRILENGVLRKKVGPKKDEITGDWRKLHDLGP
jgi:hypothetical protein